MDQVTRGKQANAFGFEVDAPQLTGTIHVTLDMLKSQPNPTTNSYVDSQAYDVVISGVATQVVQWINNSGVIVGWQNNALQTVQWVRGPGSSYIMNLEDGDAFGKYIGVTLSSSDVSGTISSVMLRYFWREMW